MEAGTTSGTPKPATSSRKRKAESTTTSPRKQRSNKEGSSTSTSVTVGGASSSGAVFFNLPFTLKTILRDEREHITRQGFGTVGGRGGSSKLHPKPSRNVHHLPASLTVKQVLHHFERKRGANKDPDQKKQLSQFCTGLLALFDESLERCLLYPQEFPQYKVIMAKEAFRDKPPSSIYGSEYLLRLLVRIPVLLQAEFLRIPPTFLERYLNDLVVLMQKNWQVCFKGSYREPLKEELLDLELM